VSRRRGLGCVALAALAISACLTAGLVAAIRPWEGGGSAAPSAQEESSKVAEAFEELPDGGQTNVVQEGLDVVSASSEVLETYEVRGDCVLAKAGYLDLLGNTWGCVVQGDEWVELCVVSQAQDEEGSVVSTWHMDSEQAAQALGV
jgi:hypothetical protein